MVRLYDERERGFEILGLEKVKKYLGEKFGNCKDAWEIDEILKEENDGLAGYRCENVEEKRTFKKYEIVEKSAEIKWKDRKNITTGCAADDPDPKLIEKFDTLQEAQKELKKYKTSIKEDRGNNGTFYVVKEYSIEENEYDEDGDWISGGDVWDYSDMKIDIIEKPSYSLFAACANYEEAEKAIENYNGDGEVYISFN